MTTRPSCAVPFGPCAFHSDIVLSRRWVCVWIRLHVIRFLLFLCSMLCIWYHVAVWIERGLCVSYVAVGTQVILTQFQL